jgi:hypothetical protein
MGKFLDKGKDVSSFLQSNSLVAKTSFIILIVIVFIILFNLGITIITYLIGPNKDPYIIDGMIDAQTPYEIEQDPNNKNSITIYRSDNERNGIEFTWSVWIYINQSENFAGDGKRHVFSKGDWDSSANAENAPGLYLEKSGNALNAVIKMDTYDATEDITIEGITKNKWMNIIIRCKNIAIDVYINGIVTKQVVIKSVPKQNYGNIFICKSIDGEIDGFQGKISNLRYFDNTVNLAKIQDIVADGPNLDAASVISDVDYININPPYLSFKWYLNKSNIKA